ncbi:lytic transglycosylase domain-containing protein [Azospirillum halopraeferens]|uniref:lytic transglycosylase domain-containing protein n=1 Tax=Azospirillum halopraeferens TaxID=34010 RepID=UPI0004265B4B|nr:lytic transglycosylase domain-containing protein [Azospirillum halopraeferens]
MLAAGLACLFVALTAPQPAAATLSGAEAAAYKEALLAAERGRFDEAGRLAAGARERLPAKVIRWMQLASPGGGSFTEITAFLRENPGWPNQAGLRRAAEAVMPDSLPDDRVIAWFDDNPPLTNRGFMRYADALVAMGRGERALTLVRARWTGSTFSAADEQAFLSRYRAMLRAQDHAARLDSLLWERQEDAARRMFPLVDEGRRALAEARLGIAAGRGNADALLARVPAALRNDAGLIYERVRFRRQRGDTDGAVAMLQTQPSDTGRSVPWWTERHILARRAIEQGDYALAYRIAAGHRQEDGVAHADAEFLAGWLALRFLNRPSDAFAHFQKLHRSVSAPISKARGAYWSGRAAEAMGDREQARTWFRSASAFSTTFYGQLAANALGAAPALPVEPAVSRDAAAAFERRELVRVARLLAQIEGRDASRVTAFVRRISLDSKAPEDYALAARLARDIGRPDLAIAAAKDAAQEHVFLVDGGYPMLSNRGSRPEPALVHAIIRQESTFNPTIVSSAGARGLMQLMPGTAQLVARQLGIAHTPAKLNDPDHNVRLGSAYIADLLDRFNGSHVLAIAAYNAGPGRVSQWLTQYGDPRGQGIDIIDWIEMIPFSETRNYVQRVLEALIVYRGRLDGSRADLDLVKELRR